MQKRKKTSIIIYTTIIINIFFVHANYGFQTIIYPQNTNTTIENNIFITDISYKLIQTQLAIGSGKKLQKNEKNTITILEKIESLALNNIVKNIELSENKSQELEKYMKASNEILLEASFTISNLKQEQLILKSEVDDCLIGKGISDKNYYLALKNHENTVMDQSVEESKLYATCASTQKISFNAQQEVLDRLEYYYLVLSQKTTYLSTKEQLLIQHFDVLKDDVIEELNAKLVLENLGQ